MESRGFTHLGDTRLVYRGNKILSDLFSNSVHSVRQLSQNDSSAKGFYRFLQNDRVSEADIVSNLVTNCQAACKGKLVICIQDTSELLNLRWYYYISISKETTFLRYYSFKIQCQ